MQKIIMSSFKKFFDQSAGNLHDNNSICLSVKTNVRIKKILAKKLILQVRKEQFKTDFFIATHF